MNIKEIEERSGLTRANIRYYEKEGLLECERRDNGYRDYTQENLEQLKKIRLLRELGCSLEEIRTLQVNPDRLCEFMEQHAAAIERQTTQLGNAKTVWTEIRQEGVTYSQINADRYLYRLEELARERSGSSYSYGGMTAPVQPAATSGDGEPEAPHPWRRFFARGLDYSLYQLILTIVWEGVLHQMTADSFLYSCGRTILTIVLMLLIEPILLHFFGTTFGKWIFGIYLSDMDGSRLRYRAARMRTWQVLWQGEALYVPVLALICNYRSHKKYLEWGKTDWDTEYDVDYQFRDRKPAVYTGCWILAVAVMAFFTVVLDEYQYIPPNRGALTVEEFAENYNWYVKKLSLVNGSSPDSSSYLNAQAQYQPQTEEPGVVVIDLFSQEHVKPEFRFETEGDAILSVSFGGSHILEPEEWFSGYYPETVYAVMALAGAQEDISPWNFGFRRFLQRMYAIGFEKLLNSYDVEEAGLHLVNDVQYNADWLSFLEGTGVLINTNSAEVEFSIQFRAEVVE